MVVLQIDKEGEEMKRQGKTGKEWKEEDYMVQH